MTKRDQVQEVLDIIAAELSRDEREHLLRILAAEYVPQAIEAVQQHLKRSAGGQGWGSYSLL